jgi:hypothetical protein
MVTKAFERPEENGVREVNHMKDLKVDAKRDINDEKIENIPEGVKGGVKDLEKDARTDGKTIDKEAKRVRRDKL